MYSRKEASQLRHEFWTAFGQYMAPVLSADGEKINWVNYKTERKGIYFRMDADNKKARISIEISSLNDLIRNGYFDRFLARKIELENLLGEQWIWETDLPQDGESKSKIYRELTDVNVFSRNDWPALISFFKRRMIALDAFWSYYKYEFQPE